jgi:hypothetical protein
MDERRPFIRHDSVVLGDDSRISFTTRRHKSNYQLSTVQLRLSFCSDNRYYPLRTLVKEVSYEVGS